MAAIFGQEVVMEITDLKGNQVLDARGLRVDFDVRHIEGFSVANVSVYNLNETTIGNLIGAKDRYCTIKVRFHDGPYVTIMDKFYISNALDQRLVPNSITQLYLYDSARLIYLEQQIDVDVEGYVSLKSMIDTIMQKINFTGKIHYQSWPRGLAAHKTPRRKANLQGSVQQILRELGKEYTFNVYTVHGGFLLIYKPKLDQVHLTELDKLPVIELHTDNMRANPMLAPAQLNITSNLDPNIQPGSVVDIRNLITAGSNTEAETLQLADQYLANNIAGYSRYQILSCQHKGSNFTGDWFTMANGTAPTHGKVMPTQTWFKNGN